MSPYQHGEVFVTDDGGETDLDLGHYERFTSARVTPRQQRHHRQGLLLGHPEGAPRRLSRADRAGDSPHHRRDQGVDPQGRRATPTSSSSRSAAPSATSRACRSWRRSASSRRTSGKDNVIYVHLTLVPFMQAAAELKTKATQHSVKELRAIGIQPDVLLCRTDRYPAARRSSRRSRCSATSRRRRSSRPRTSRRSTRCRWPSTEQGLDEIIVKLLGLRAAARSISRAGRTSCAA